MPPTFQSALADAISKRDQDIIRHWVELQSKFAPRRSVGEEQETVHDCREFLTVLKAPLSTGHVDDIRQPAWESMREFLTALSSRRAKKGFTPSETASFVFSLKEPLFKALQSEVGGNSGAFLEAVCQATDLVDRLGLFTIEAFQRTREEIIARQQRELLELSTPVMRLWDKILALPLIGTLDSERTQVVMQNLLEAIVETRSDFAIIDITGVPVVDTLVAQYLLKTVSAARLMGADCLISGIRPQIAQTIIHLGVDLHDVTTKATLADAFAVALRRSGQILVQGEKAGAAGAR